ncbi:MAG: hypothetical protein D6690_10820 [Nitrospirae bacterium]|nr:MAG: hypothetical protein D6690_10820 [Nitrospirota bacterium]
MRGGQATSNSLAGSTTPWLDLDHLIRLVLYIYILSLPFKSMLIVERNGFIVLLILLAFWCLRHRRLFLIRTPFDRPIIAYVLWIGLTIPFAMFPAYSLKEYGKLLQQILVFYAICYFFQDGMHRRYLLVCLLTPLVLVSAYGIVQYDPTHPQAMQSFLPAEVWLTTYLVMFLPIVLALAFEIETPWIKTPAYATVALSAISLVLTQSRAGLVALVSELWVWGWLLRRHFALVIAGGITLTISVALAIVLITDWGGLRSFEELRAYIPIRSTPSSVVHRFDIWAFCVSEIIKHPIVGIGYGKDNYKLVYGEQPEVVEPGHAPVKSAGVHNILLYHALHVGLPGLFVFLWLMGAILHQLFLSLRFTKNPEKRSLLLGTYVSTVGLMVRCFFDHMFIGTLAILYWVILAVTVIYLTTPEESFYSRS